MNTKKIIILAIAVILIASIVFAGFNEDTDISVTGLQYSSQAWGDYNNDGNPDLAICGSDSGGDILTKLYILNNSQLTEDTNQSIINVTECSLNFGDLNMDGYLDLVVSGRNSTGINNFSTVIYRYNGTNFNKAQILKGVKFSNTILGDINNDSYLDLAMIGCTNGTHSISDCDIMNSSIYMNNGTALLYNKTWSQNLTHVWKGSIAFGDYDNDGDLDLVLSGATSNSYEDALTNIYINNGTTFNEDTVNVIEGIYWGSLAWGDFDNDTALDLFITGKNTSGNRITKIFRSDANENNPNTRPSAPSTLNASFENGIINITWSLGSDTETPTKGLYYNLRAGSNKTTNDIVSSYFARSSNPTQSYLGNQGQLNFTLLTINERCTWYSVQTIDTGFMKSAFSIPQNISFNETCDSYDNDCDDEYNGTVFSSKIDESFDQDNDGYFPYNSTINGTNYNCTGYQNYDCDDSNVNFYPGAACTRPGYTGATWTWNLDTLQCDCINGVQETEQYGGSSSQAQAVESESETETKETEEVIQTQEAGITEELEEVMDFEGLIDEISATRVEHTRKAYVSNGRTQVIEKIKNIDLFNLDDVKITLEIPKTIIKNTDEIIQVTKFEVIEYDPKVKFYIGDIEPREERIIEYTLKKELTEEELKEVLFKIELKEVTNRDEREELFRKTQEIVNITTTAEIDEAKGETEFTLDIGLVDDSILYDAKIYTEIPKCLVEIIEEIMIESDVEFDIVSRDPLIVWHFKKLTKGDQLKYIIKSIADEDCLNQAKTYAIAKHIVLLEAELLSPKEQIDKILIPLLAILAIVGMLFFLSQYTLKRKHNTDVLSHIIKHTDKKYKNGFKETKIVDKLVLDGFSPKHVEDAINYHKKNSFMRFVNEHMFGGEVLFLSILIILNILDFFKFLPGDMEFLKKIISWSLLSYLLYEVSPMKVLFGDTKFKKFLDTSLLLLFFSLIFKLIVEFAKNAFNEAVYFRHILLLIAKYSIEATNISLYVGFIGLMLVSIFITFYIPIGKPSFYHVFTSIFGKHHIETKNVVLRKTAKFISVYLILLLFYITIYNFVFEWIAIAIDASIFMVAVIITLIMFIRREYHLLIYHKIKGMFKVKVGAGVEKIVSVADSFNIKFFHLLSYKKFIYLAVIGILMLHLVTEAGIFVIPYVTGATDPTYFSELGEGHMPILNFIGPLQSLLHKEVTRSLLSIQIAGLNLLNSIPIILVYLMNIFAVLFLLINPLIIWLHMYKERHHPAHKVKPIKSKLYVLYQLLFVVSIAALLLTPIFKIGFASNKIFGETEVGGDFGSSIRGIDIQTGLIENYNMIFWVIGVSVLLGAAYFMFRKKYSKQITGTINTINLILIISYLSMFYIDIYRFFVSTLGDLFNANIFFFVHFALFFVMSSLFYTIGILLLALELFVRGEIYIPLFVIRVIKPLYRGLERFYHHLLPHHHLPHLIFYEHHIELEHGRKEEHLHKHISKIIHHTHDDEKLLKRLVEKGVEKGKHELYFIEEHLLEHNWPRDMVVKAINKAKKDPQLRKKLLKIRKHHHDRIILKKLAKLVQEWYDKGHSLEHIVIHAKKRGWTEEDVREILPKLKLKKKDRILFKAYKL
jgi:hypothetical protein